MKDSTDLSTVAKYDSKTLQYDLAITYAKAKLEHALQNKLINYDDLPSFVAECDYLFENFRLGLSHYEWLDQIEN